MNQDFTNTYHISDLILKLQEMLKNHGDLPVVLADPDTGWRMEIGVAHDEADDLEEWPERIEINGSYSGRPSGAKPSPQNAGDAEAKEIEEFTWRTFAQFHPLEASATWPERFWTLFQELRPGVSREEMESVMRELEREETQNAAHERPATSNNR